MKKFCVSILAILLAFNVCACGSSATSGTPASSAAQSSASGSEAADTGDTAAKAAKDPAVELVYAEVNPESSLMGQTANYFRDQVKKLSGGSVTIDVQYSGVLGAEGDVLDAMLGGGGGIDIARIATFSLTNYGVKITKLLSCPYIFKDRSHFWKFAASDLGTKVLNEPSDLGLGVHGMFYVEEGFRNFFFKTKVSGLSDIAGKKIRVSTDPTMTGMVKDLGASPTVVSFTELYTSLSTGVVDAAEQPVANYQSNAFNEVAPYMVLDHHTMGCGEVIISDSAWGKLTENQKAALEEAGKLASKYNAGESEKNEQKCMDELKKKDVTFIEVSDMQKWKDACSETISKVVSGMDKEYKQICDMA